MQTIIQRYLTTEHEQGKQEITWQHVLVDYVPIKPYTTGNAPFHLTQETVSLNTWSTC